jgi:hypothetical protein
MEGEILNEQESKELAQLVSCHLRELTADSLKDYLRTVYRLDSPEGLSTDVIYAVEVAGGNFANGNTSSDPVRWWEISGNVCREVPPVDMRPFNSASDAGKLWPHPIISFYAEFPLVLSKEGIGIALSTKGYEEILRYFRILSVVKENGSFRILAEQKNWLFKR